MVIFKAPFWIILVNDEVNSFLITKKTETHPKKLVFYIIRMFLRQHVGTVSYFKSLMPDTDTDTRNNYT